MIKINLVMDAMKIKLIIEKCVNCYTKWFVVSLLFLFYVTSAMAQEAKISGIVVDKSDGSVLPGSTVVVTNTSTGFNTSAATNTEGKFKITNLPLGGPYTIEVSFVGYVTHKTTDVQLHQGDEVNLKVSIVSDSEKLDEVVISGSTLKSRTDRLGHSFAITGRTIATIPTPTRSFEQLAVLAPQSYVADVGSRPFSGVGLAGGKGSSTGYLIDGVNARRNVFGGSVDGPAFTISQEAIREFEIQTNEYSVLNGRNTGGSVSAVTQSGTNVVHGGAWIYTGGGDSFLSQRKSVTGAELSVVPRQTQYGFKLGLPIIKDKLHFFGVYDRYSTEESPGPKDQNYIDYSNPDFATTSEAESFYGTTEANINDILASAKNKGYDAGTTGTLLRELVTQNIFGRLDYNINDRHSAALRVNYLNFSKTNDNYFGHGNGSSVSDGNAFGTSSTGYTFLQHDIKVIGSLRSRFGDNIVNNLKLQYVDTSRDNAPDDAEQEARVYVGTGNGKFVSFGQHTWVPEVAYSNSIQIIDDVTVSAGDVVWTFGTNNQFYTQSDRFPHWTAPVVVYDNLTEFNNNQPSFYRQLVSKDVDLTKPIEYSITELGLYAEADFDLTSEVNMKLGLRWDAWIYGRNTPVANTALLNSGLKFRGKTLDNTNTINDINNFQPRLQLKWDVGNEEKNIIKLGAGVFTGPVTTQPISFTFTNDGVSRHSRIFTNTAEILAATGAGDYSKKANWLSSKVADGSYSLNAGGASSVILVDPNFQMPQMFKTNVSYTRFLSDKIKVGVSGFYSVTWNQMYHQDVNYKTAASSNPIDNREVVERANTDFASVLVITNADYASTYLSAVFDVQLNIGKDGFANFSYSVSQAYGGTSYTAGGDRAEFIGTTYTANRYKDRAFSPASGAGEKFVATLAFPSFYGVTIGASIIAAKQRRFSITTGGNPTGSSNTIGLAYAPSANNNNNAIDNASYQRLLSTVAPEVRKVLVENHGSVLAANVGLQPWIYQTSLSISKRFLYKERYGMTIKADIFNILNLINHRAGYYNQVAVNNTRENTEQVLQLFNWDGNTNQYSVADGNAGQYRLEGQPYNIQLGVKFEF